MGLSLPPPRLSTLILRRNVSACGRDYKPSGQSVLIHARPRIPPQSGHIPSGGALPVPPKLGFAWILSSESRLINSLHEIFGRCFFVVLLSSRKDCSNGGERLGAHRGRILHEASLRSFLIFCKRFRPSPFLPGRLHPGAVGARPLLGSRAAPATGRDRDGRGTRPECALRGKRT
jgi:hypothetical protein